MRYGRTFLLAVVGTVVLWTGQGEAACRAEGEYRVTGPDSRGTVMLSETASHDAGSSGIVVLTLSTKLSSPVGSGVQQLSGDYFATQGPGLSADGCRLTLTFFFTPANRPVSMTGALAFGGAVILFDSHEFVGPSLDLNLTLGIRSDFILRQ